MAFIRMNIGSKAISGHEELAVYVPSYAPHEFGKERTKVSGYNKNERYQVLWLIHGGSDDYMSWPLESMIMRYADAAQLIVVMPTVRDMLSTHPACDSFEYVANELPKVISKLFPISLEKEDNFIAGLSYGGYFAYRIALNYPDRYSCVGSFSSPLDVEMDIERYHKGDAKFDTKIKGTDRDVLGMATELKNKGADLPKMFQTCGTEDFTWDFNVSARDHFRRLGLDHTWTEHPGVHCYEFWDAALKEYIDFLPLKRKPFEVGGDK